MITGLDHFVLVCPEIEAATAVYESLLGRPADWRASADGAATAIFRLENTSLELMAPDGEGPVPQPAPTAVQPAQATAASARQASEGMNREAFLSDLESSYLAVRAERDRLKSSAEEGEAEAERLRRNVAELRAAVAEKDGELDVARRRADGEGNKRGLAEEAMRMADERVDRTAAEADALREEIR